MPSRFGWGRPGCPFGRCDPRYCVLYWSSIYPRLTANARARVAAALQNGRFFRARLKIRSAAPDDQALAKHQHTTDPRIDQSKLRAPAVPAPVSGRLESAIVTIQPTD